MDNRVRITLEYPCHPELPPEVFEYDNCSIMERRAVDVIRNEDDSVKELIPSNKLAMCMKCWSGYETFEESEKPMVP